MKENNINERDVSNKWITVLINVAYVAIAVIVWILFQSLIGIPMKMV